MCRAAVATAIGAYLKTQKPSCKKVPYYTPAAAKKALRDHGYGKGIKQWYLCPICNERDTYHLTSKKRFKRK